MEFRISISDRSFNFLEFLDDEIASVNFDYARTGGCGNFNFILPRKYCDEKFISGDFNVKIYLRNDTTKAYDLWYQGVVQSKTPKIAGYTENISVNGHGYVDQLSDIQINVTYTNKELSYMVKDIMDNYVVGVKDVTYNGADIDNTGFTADSISFTTDVLSALKTLGDLASTFEWGVDANRKLYFKRQSELVGFIFFTGSQIINFQEEQSFIDMVNRVIFQGGDVAGTPYTATFNDTVSQLKYGRKDKVYQNSSITTATVAQQIATSIFTQFNDVVRKASCDIVDYSTRIEAVLPIKLFVLKAIPAVTYGTKKYGTFLYSGLINRQINRIRYTIDSNRTLKTSLDLGQYLPDSANKIKQIEYKLEQLRSAAL